jgi:hypothetical protein
MTRRSRAADCDPELHLVAITGVELCEIPMQVGFRHMLVDATERRIVPSALNGADDITQRALSKLPGFENAPL